MLGFHVTTSENLQLILKNGFIPSIGPRSHKIKEQIPKIYFFPSIEHCCEALVNWLGDEFDENDELFVIKVNLKGLVLEHIVGFEITSNHHIPPEKIIEIYSEDELIGIDI